MIRYTQEEKAFLKEFIPGHTWREIQKAFEDRFRPIELTQIRAYIKNNHIRTGRKGHFKKGVPSWNKGISYKPGGRAIETQFKKGNIPHDHVPVGTIVINSYGYKRIKVGEPNKWKYLHRFTWEQAHGEIPKCHIVICLDGNKQNCSLDNLACISRSTHMRMLRYGLGNPGKEGFKTALLIAEIEKARGKRKYDIHSKMSRKG